MSLDRDIALLGRVGLFADLSPDQLRLLAFSAGKRELARGTVLFERGETANSGFIVAAGVIELGQEHPGGRRVLAACEYGSLIGEIALFVDTVRPATAMAAVDSEVLEIGRPLMQRMLNEYPHVAARMRARLARELSLTVSDLDRLKADIDSISFTGGRG